MSLGKFFVSRAFFINLAIALIIVVAIVFGTLKSLNHYTRHGISYPVPNLTGLKIAEAQASAKANKLQIQIIDSVYNKAFAPGTVVDQQPVANSNVKENRTILLTINSLNPETVILPKLTDISFRQAQVLVERSGLFVGSISYQPSEYNDLVLEATQDSAKINTGDKIIKGTIVDLIVGRSKGNLKTPLPNLTGFSINEAQVTLTSAMLNEGVLIYDGSFETAEDSLNAKVWQQQPNSKFVKTVDLGSSIDMWLTIDSMKINSAYKK